MVWVFYSWIDLDLWRVLARSHSEMHFQSTCLNYSSIVLVVCLFLFGFSSSHFTFFFSVWFFYFLPAVFLTACMIMCLSAFFPGISVCCLPGIICLSTCDLICLTVIFHRLFDLTTCLPTLFGWDDSFWLIFFICLIVYLSVITTSCGLIFLRDWTCFNSFF